MRGLRGLTNPTSRRSPRAAPNRSEARILAAAVSIALTCGLASATLVRRMELPEVVSLAGTIVEGRVARVDSFWEGKRIFTEVTVTVARAHKGTPGAGLSFRQLGGRVDSPVPLAMTVPGAPIHRVGDRGFYFVEERPGAHPTLIGIWTGHAPIRRDDRGEYLTFNGARFTPGEFGQRVRQLVIEQQAGAGSGDPPPGRGASSGPSASEPPANGAPE